MTLTLYYHKGSCSLASHIALEETGAAFEARKIDFGKAEQRGAAYLAINPKGRVPALVTDEGVLTESPVILGYIAQTFKEARLADNDSSFHFGDMQAFNLWVASTLHPAFAHAFRTERYVDGAEHLAAVRAKAPQLIADCYQLCEDALFRGPWVMGERYTIADPYLYVMTTWLARSPELPKLTGYPRIADHFARMEARPAVLRAEAAEAADA